MAREFNLSQELQTPEVRSFEKRMSESYGRDMRLQDIPIKNFVDVTTGLLETKVNSTVMRGAEDQAGFWSSLINVVNMTSPIQQVPIVSQRDFKVRTGKMPKSGLEESGGKFTKVTLDTTDEDKIRYAYLKIDKDDVDQRNFNVVEACLMAAGSAFAKNILTDILAHYVSVAGNSQALGGDKYFVAVMKAIALNKADGFGCSAIVIDSDDYVQAITEETTGGTMPWLLTINGEPLGDNFGNGVGRDGLSGRLFNRIPVYQVANDSTLSGDILVIDTEAASVLGFAPGGQIRVSESINTMHDLIENKIQAKYDYANGNANAVAKVTGA